MARPVEEFEVPGIGLLQWWADSPHERQHWYVSGDQEVYRVVIEDGQPAAVSTRAGVFVCHVHARTDDMQGALI